MPIDGIRKEREGSAQASLLHPNSLIRYVVFSQRAEYDEGDRLMLRYFSLLYLNFIKKQNLMSVKIFKKPM